MGRKFKFAKTELQYRGVTAKPKFMYIEVLPEQDGELTYTGEEQFPTWKNLDPLKVLIEGEKSAINAGEHFITVTPLGNFAWPDNTQTPKQISYTIKRKKLGAVPSQKGSLTFNNTQQTPQWNNYNAQEITIGGTYQNQTDAGTYIATFTPDNNHCWSDGTYAAKNVSWSIEILKLAKPSAQTTSMVYTGSEITLAVSNYNANYMSQSGTISATNVDDYSVTYSLNSATNTTWADGSTADVVINWHITVLKIAKVTANTTKLPYNGTAQEPEWQNYDANYINKTGDAQTNAGNYSTTFSLKNDNFSWSDGTKSDVVINWHITVLKIAKVTANTTKLPYNGTAQEPEWQNYDANYINKTGDAQTNAGNYSTTFSLKNDNLSWSDGTKSDVVINWKITPQEIAIPTENTRIVYDGMNKNASYVDWNGYNQNIMTVQSETYSQANTYSATFTITDNNYTFSVNRKVASAIWHIDRAKIADSDKPIWNPAHSDEISGNYYVHTWSDSENGKTVAFLLKNVVWNFDKDCMTATNWDTVVTSTGNWVVDIKPDSNHTWQDGSTSAVRFVLCIIPHAAPNYIWCRTLQAGVDPAIYNYGQSNNLPTVPATNNSIVRCYFVVPRGWSLKRYYTPSAVTASATIADGTLPNRSVDGTGKIITINTNSVVTSGVMEITAVIERNGYSNGTYKIGQFTTL